MTRTTFREADIARALKGASKGGFPVGRVEICKDGAIVLVAGKPGEPDANISEADLDRELEEFEVRHGEG